MDTLYLQIEIIMHWKSLGYITSSEAYRLTEALI